MAINATTTQSWAKSWLRQLERYLADSPIVYEGTLVHMCVVDMPGKVERRREVVALIHADESWPGLVAEAALRCKGFDIEGELG